MEVSSYINLQCHCEEGAFPDEAIPGDLEIASGEEHALATT